MVQRLTYRRKNNFNTRSNKVKKVKTPGGKLAYQMVKKQASGPRCVDCKGQILGVPCLRPYQYKRLHKNERTVSRAYGGSRCMNCVRERIIRAFLIEEARCVKNISKATPAKPTAAATAPVAPVAAAESKKPKEKSAKQEKAKSKK